MRICVTVVRMHAVAGWIWHHDVLDWGALNQWNHLSQFCPCCRFPYFLCKNYGYCFMGDLMIMNVSIWLWDAYNSLKPITKCPIREGDWEGRMQWLNKRVGQCSLPTVTNEAPLSWPVFLGCSTCPLRHSSGQGDLNPPSNLVWLMFGRE